VAILVVSLFKLTPLLFLLLLPMLDTRRGWMYAAITAAAFLVIMGGSYVADSSAWHAFLQSVKTADEPGQLGNPSTLALARELIAIVGQKTGLAVDQAVAYVLYAIAVIFTVGLSLPYYRAVRASGRPDWRVVVLYLACLVFALIMPRFKTYSFILVVPPALYVLTQSRSLRPLWLLFGMLVLTTSIPFPISPFIQVFWRYYPLLLVFLVWSLLLREIGTWDKGIPV